MVVTMNNSNSIGSFFLWFNLCSFSYSMASFLFLLWCRFWSSCGVAARPRVLQPNAPAARPPRPAGARGDHKRTTSDTTGGPAATPKEDRHRHHKRTSNDTTRGPATTPQEDQQRHHKRTSSDTTRGAAATPQEDQLRHHKRNNSDTTRGPASTP